MYFIENFSAWTQGELGHFSTYQICRMFLPHEEKRGRVLVFDPLFALDVKGGE